MGKAARRGGVVRAVRRPPQSAAPAMGGEGGRAARRPPWASRLLSPLSLPRRKPWCGDGLDTAAAPCLSTPAASLPAAQIRRSAPRLPPPCRAPAAPAPPCRAPAAPPCRAARHGRQGRVQCPCSPRRRAPAPRPHRLGGARACRRLQSRARRNYHAKERELTALGMGIEGSNFGSLTHYK